MEKFIISIFDEYSSELNKTKILITCRDYFWNDVRRSLIIPEIKISPFNEQLVLDFYTKKLNGDQKKIAKALDIAEEFAIENNENEKNYIPFLVDIIARIVKSPTFSGLNQIEQKSEFLSNDHNVDILISLICEREIVKLGTFSVDKQILFFMRMASEKANGISVYDVKNVLSEINVNNGDLIIENFKGHPLIDFHGNKFNFRYDVFDIYFKSLLIVNYFKKLDITSLDEKTIDTISGYLKYDSSFTRSVSEKLSFSDNLLLFLLENIEAIKKTNASSIELFISSLVILTLDIINLDLDYQFNTETKTEVIEKLFSDYKRGNFYPRKQEEVRKKLATITILSYMINHNVIIKFKDPKKPTMQQYNIAPKYKTVIDFIEQGIPSEELSTLVEDIQLDF
ncbi:hypothetical protein [Yersinia enterocolitica]|uniref:hypothetical protein n=1 Tax=Yersinia enterocolitica TaxID=630 RepID=UPI0002E1E000|nr:hypothetical protein [Yersinia enterocolitica]